MAYPIKMLKDEDGQSFVPLTSLDAVIGEKNLQYIFDAKQIDVGHFKIEYKDLEMDKLVNSIIVIRWPQITSVVKPSFLQLNEQEKVALYNGTGTEYFSLEDASNTINMFAYDGSKWILTSGAGSGSGHIITDDEGNTLEQQKILNFVGFNVENDAANRATKIVNPTPINNLTTSQSGQGSLDAYQGYVLSGRTIPTGGTKGQVLAKTNNNDYQVEWINKDDENVIMGDGSIKEIIELTYDEYVALEEAGQLKDTTEYHISDMNEQGGTYITESEIIDLMSAKLDLKDGVALVEGQDLNTIITPGTYRSSSSTITNALLNIPSNMTSGFVMIVFRDRSSSNSTKYYRQEIKYGRATLIRRTADMGATWTPWEIIPTYAIGDVFVTSTNENPGERLGGNWSLINKEFSSYMNAPEDPSPYFTPTESASLTSAAFARNGNGLSIRIGLKPLVELGDTQVNLGQVNMNAFGVTRFPLTRYAQFAGSDTGNGAVMYNVTYEGAINATDFIPKTDGGTMPANTSSIYIEQTYIFNHSYMMDDACNRFYWKRTS